MYLPKPRPPGFTVACWFFARALAAVFFCAFASLLVQVLGLIGAWWRRELKGIYWPASTLGPAPKPAAK